MKISSSIRELYNSQHDVNVILEKRVSILFSEAKRDNWFYKGRVKGLESFAQKLETGRFIPEALEDFFGCTLVVENRTAIQEAIQLVKNYCNILYQKPKFLNETHKYPDLFSFDDLRLYVKLKPLESIPGTPLNEIVFEVQIKTFLQHAWSLATYDLIYKGKTISWGKARLAFQIKAMLEHAEISIEQVDNISHSPSLAMIDPKTKGLKEIVNWLSDQWPEDLLPNDVVRLSQTVFDVIAGLKLTLSDLIQAVENDTAAGFGTNLSNLSPYEIIIKALSHNKKEQLLKFFRQNSFYTKLKIFVTPEMEMDDFVKGALENRFIRAKS